MNITERLQQPEIATRTVGQGFSLLRRCHDNRMLAGCALFQAAYPDIKVKSDVNGVNRLGIHLFASGEVCRQRAIGQIGLPYALQHLLDNVPTLKKRLSVDIVGIVASQDAGEDHQDLYHLEAEFSDDSQQRLKAERQQLREAFESLRPKDGAEFRWTNPPENMGIAVLPPHTPRRDLGKIEQSAEIALRVPLRIALTAVQCTMPGLGNPQPDR